MTVTYPVIFTETNDNKETVLVQIPDIEEGVTEGYGMEDAIFMAKDLLRELLLEYRADGQDFPEPSEPDDIDVSEGRFADAGESQVMEVTVEVENEQG